ncbi:MAG: hypothetical protein WA555_11985 [Candidatus Sulfotelmatobacter sp.]
MRLGGDGTLLAGASVPVFALFQLFGGPPRCAAYAVLAHGAIVDSAWSTNLRSLLLKRFPNATADELKEAKIYSYSGAHWRFQWAQFDGREAEVAARNGRA